LVLNKSEHASEIRSSDYLFVYFVVTITTSIFSLYILSDQTFPSEDSVAIVATYTSASHTLSAFTILITAAFSIEVYPRSGTQVQIRAREKQKLSDYELANAFSRITYHYVHSTITLGASRPLKGTDVESTMLPDLHTKVNYDRVGASWERSKAKAAQSGKTPSYFFAVLHAYRAKASVGLVLRLAGFGIFFVPTLLFRYLLQLIRDYSDAVHGGTDTVPPPIHIGLLIALAMFISNMTSSLLVTTAFQVSSEVGLQARAATVALIYAKALKLSPAARQRSTLGEITNHMAVDAEKMITAADFLPFIVTVPFELMICLYLLHQQLGWPTCAGLVVFAILTPIQAKMGVFMNTHANTRLEFMDSRIRLLTEILGNIKIVKLYGWEDAFRKKVDTIRAKELGALKSLATIRSILTIVYNSVTLVMALATFSVFAVVGGPGMTPGKITAEVVFVSITLFGIMNKPLGMITHLFSQTIGIMVACRRIQGFLLMEEIDSSVVQRYSRQVPSGNSPTVAVEIENGTFAWEKQVEETIRSAETDDESQPLLSGAASPTVYRPTLNNINIRIADGSLTAVVGRIGQGKSSLLGAVMGEMYKLQGSVKVFGDIAYVPQQAWIINATLKDNILFGKPFDQEKYDRIVFASGLVPDFAMLPAGDQTEIGERGINLSGGQKQRVSLARAAYQDADVYLLDDPLSAVDAHVDQHLWNNLVGPNGLLSSKTRILVTHGIHHLEHVDQILVFKDGSISEAGHYDELMAANGAFHQLIKEYSIGQKKKKTRHDKDKTKVGESDSEDDSARNTIVATEDAAKKDDDDDDDANGELVSDEKMVDGKVGSKILMVYARAVSLPKALFCFFMYVAWQGVHISTNLWLRKWINDTEDNERTGGTLHPGLYYLLGYGGLVLLFMFFDLLVNYVSEVVCGIQGSKVLFNRLLNRIFRLPMSFFDTTPMGRI
ncbi:Canalicular multispecific organic anion transporter 2, partial [Podila clonocystis]